MAGITHFDMILRVAIGAALGGAIGYERDRHGRQAGLRTHLIVALASATFMVVSAHFSFFQNYAGTPGIGVDPSRIAASVVTGIGFLAGGTILKTGLNVQGLTTAAGLWLVAAIGLCSGAGMYPLAFAVTLMGLAALTVFRLLEGKDDRLMRREVALLLDEQAQSIQSLLSSLKDAGITVADFDFERHPENFRIKLRFQSVFPIDLGTHGFISMIEKEPGVQGLQVRPIA